MATTFLKCTMSCLSILAGCGIIWPPVDATRQVQPSCAGRCNAGRVWTCFCNVHCRRHGDCCHDYNDLCSSDRVTEANQQQRTFTKLDSNSSLSEVVSALWRSDTNRIPPSQMTLNVQQRTTSRDRRDRAHNPLFQRVGGNYTQRQTYRRLSRLLDNYNPDVLVQEIETSSEVRENEAFIDAILETGPMLILERYLVGRGDIDRTPDSLKNLLQRLWFDVYPRRSGGAISSSGFEHVMVGEVNRRTITGFHNWFQMYREELRGRLNYHGYVFKAEPYVIGARFVWMGGRKQLGSMFLGVSPEFDVAVYTLCIVVRPNMPCNFRLGRKNVSIRTYDNRHVPGLQVATAFIANVS